MNNLSRDHEPSTGSALESAEADRPEESAVYPEWRPITWRGASRIEYSHEELLDLLAYVRNVTAGDGHNIVKAFNGNTITRLIAQANLAVRPTTVLDAPAPAEARSDQPDLAPSSAKPTVDDSSRDDQTPHPITAKGLS